MGHNNMGCDLLIELLLLNLYGHEYHHFAHDTFPNNTFTNYTITNDTFTLTRS